MPAPILENSPPELSEPIRFWVTAQGSTEMAEGERLIKRLLPDPPFLPPEGPPPYDLPRPGPRRIVHTHPGTPRLPDPPIHMESP